jgi:release factor glutamine methyltransferase
MTLILSSPSLSSSAKADNSVATFGSTMGDVPTGASASTGFPAFAGNDSLGGLSVSAARRALAAAFRAAGIETPELDARVLTAHALGLEHAALAAGADRSVSAAEAETIAAAAARRLAREPVARIAGVKEFWSLPLRVTPATLVPRPETETVVEAAIAAVDAKGERMRALRIADLGTGSGALLLALLSELPHAFGIGTDISVAALAVAQENARLLGAGRAVLAACDFAASLRGPFDLIVSNPPYIPTHEIAGLAPEVRRYDPSLALDGGRDGLDGYRAIASAAPMLLAPGGNLVVEIGAGQAHDVAGLLAASGLAISAPRNDLLGIPRALLAAKAA